MINKNFIERSDFVACRTLLRGGSRSFYVASFFLPRRYRDAADALYAFCRIADDAVDCAGHLPGAQVRAIENLSKRLDNIYAGYPIDNPIDRALANTAQDFDLPKKLLEALLEGFQWDAEGRRYNDLTGVYAYSARVAGTVGAMMAVLMDTRSSELIARACDLGVAMQLTNICRDVGEDARNGRIYLPLDWLREVGIDPDQWLQNPIFQPKLGFVIQRLLTTADELYERALAGIVGLPKVCRPAIYAARVLYSEIGRQIERQACDSVTRRAIVPGWRKLQVLANFFVNSAGLQTFAQVPALPETQFLVDAVVAKNQDVKLINTVSSRVLRILELFAQLEERERAFSTR